MTTTNPGDVGGAESAGNPTTDFRARPGGVMTDEVGTVTGDLTLRTELDDDGTVRVLVRYLGADEWYRVTDSPTSLPPGATLDALHAQILEQLRA